MLKKVAGFSSDFSNIWPSVTSGLPGGLCSLASREGSHQLLTSLSPGHQTSFTSSIPPLERAGGALGAGSQHSHPTPAPLTRGSPSWEEGSSQLLQPTLLLRAQGQLTALLSLPPAPLIFWLSPCAARGQVCQSSNATIAPTPAEWVTTPSPGRCLR